MRFTKLLIAAAATAVAAPAFAGQTVVVTAAVTDTCTLNTTSATMSITTAEVKAGLAKAGQYNIWCTVGHGVTVTATHAGQLVDGAKPPIAYGVYNDAGGTTAFSNAFTGQPGTTDTPVTFYVKTAATNAIPGNYQDTITFVVAP